MPSDVVCACDEGENENWQKGDHGGFELACMNPGVCVADTRDGRGPTDATYWRLGTLGYLKPSEHRGDVRYSRSPTTAGKLPAHLRWYVSVIDLPQQIFFFKLP